MIFILLVCLTFPKMCVFAIVLSSISIKKVYYHYCCFIISSGISNIQSSKCSFTNATLFYQTFSEPHSSTQLWSGGVRVQIASIRFFSQNSNYKTKTIKSLYEHMNCNFILSVSLFNSYHRLNLSSSVGKKRRTADKSLCSSYLLHNKSSINTETETTPESSSFIMSCTTHRHSYLLLWKVVVCTPTSHSEGLGWTSPPVLRVFLFGVCTSSLCFCRFPAAVLVLPYNQKHLSQVNIKPLPW